MPVDTEHQVDYRQYIGIIVFRWQIIALCLLYSILGGVVYIQTATPIYQTSCLLMIHRDNVTDVTRTRFHPPELSHVYLLQSERLRKKVVSRLSDKWAEKMMGRNMYLPIEVHSGRRLASTLRISVRTPHPGYGKAYLEAAVDEHEEDARSIQRLASSKIIDRLEQDITRVENQIQEAEKEVVEFQRIYDIARESVQAASERAYLSALVGRRRSLMTELMMMEAQTPSLKDASAAVLTDVYHRQAETGAITVDEEIYEKDDAGKERFKVPKPELPDEFSVKEPEKGDSEEIRGMHVMRITLENLKKQEREMAETHKPSHPALLAIRKQIEDLEKKIAFAREVALRRLEDRHRALIITLGAVESAIYQWQQRGSALSEKRAELRRKESEVSRYEGNYNMLYSRLHDMRMIEEQQLDQYKLIEPVKTEPHPVWPNAYKIMMVALVIGLGTGFGLAIVAHALDNKIQSIDDVEHVLNVPFLGGVPYWVHSGLEKSIRPIVTEEHSTGAIEAYRALRTTVLAALEKENEKILIVTSADSKEGKTLTTLNLAIMIAQMNKRVLLVDMDLRRGRLHRSLGVEREPGMTDVLTGKTGMKDAVMKTRLDNLDMIAQGSSIENSAEVLQSTDLVALFDQVRDDYDYILLDTSPVLRVTDAVITATQGVGVVVYVARVNKTPKPLIRYSLDMLSEARVIGMIMNSIEMHRISSLYYSYQYPNYAYYSNAYAYGYDYYYYGDRGTSGGRGRRGWDRKRRAIAEWFRRTFLPMD